MSVQATSPVHINVPPTGNMTVTDLPHLSDYKISRITETCFIKHPVITYLAIGAVGIACAIQFPLLPVIGALALTILLGVTIHGIVLQKHKIHQLIETSTEEFEKLAVLFPELAKHESLCGIIFKKSVNKMKFELYIKKHNDCVDALKGASHSKASAILRDLQNNARQVVMLRSDIENDIKLATAHDKFCDDNVQSIATTSKNLHMLEMDFDKLKEDENCKFFADNSVYKNEIWAIELKLKEAAGAWKRFLAGESKMSFDSMLDNLELNIIGHKIGSLKWDCEHVIQCTEGTSFDPQKLLGLRLFPGRDKCDSALKQVIACYKAPKNNDPVITTNT